MNAERASPMGEKVTQDCITAATENSESGFSEETAFSSVASTPAAPDAVSLSTYLQSFAQQLQIETVDCTVLKNVSDEEQWLLMAPALLIAAPSMPLLETEVVAPPSVSPEPQRECQEWIQQHHADGHVVREEHPEPLPEGNKACSSDSLRELLLQPLRPSQTTSPCPSHLQLEGAKACSSDSLRELLLQPLKPSQTTSPCPSPLHQQNGVVASSSESLSPFGELYLDLECSSSDSSSSSEEEQIQPLPRRPPLTELTELDDTKLRINLRLVRQEEARLAVKRSRKLSSDSDTSCSLDEDDLVIDSTDSDGEVSSSDSDDIPLAKRIRRGAPIRTWKVARKVESPHLAHAIWLEQRRILYANLNPDDLPSMPTNMQPVVVLQRCPELDLKALALVSAPTSPLSDQFYSSSESPATPAEPNVQPEGLQVMCHGQEQPTADPLEEFVQAASCPYEFGSGLIDPLSDVEVGEDPLLCCLLQAELTFTPQAEGRGEQLDDLKVDSVDHKTPADEGKAVKTQLEYSSVEQNTLEPPIIPEQVIKTVEPVSTNTDLDTAALLLFSELQCLSPSAFNHQDSKACAQDGPISAETGQCDREEKNSAEEQVTKPDEQVEISQLEVTTNHTVSTIAVDLSTQIPKEISVAAAQETLFNENEDAESEEEDYITLDFCSEDENFDL